MWRMCGAQSSWQGFRGKSSMLRPRTSQKEWAQCWTWFKLILRLLVHSLIQQIHTYIVFVYIYIPIHEFCASTDHVNSCANTKSLSKRSACGLIMMIGTSSRIMEIKPQAQANQTNWLLKSVAVCSIQSYLFGDLQILDKECSTEVHASNRVSYLSTGWTFVPPYLVNPEELFQFGWFILSHGGPR